MIYQSTENPKRLAKSITFIIIGGLLGSLFLYYLLEDRGTCHISLTVYIIYSIFCNFLIMLVELLVLFCITDKTIIEFIDKKFFVPLFIISCGLQIYLQIFFWDEQCRSSLYYICLVCIIIFYISIALLVCACCLSGCRCCCASEETDDVVEQNNLQISTLRRQLNRMRQPNTIAVSHPNTIAVSHPNTIAVSHPNTIAVSHPNTIAVSRPYTISFV